MTVENLTVAYRGGRLVLDGVELTVRRGEFVAIVGRSGEGKTTLLNAIAGLTPYRGTISHTGKLSYVFQNNALFPWMTVRQNILFGVRDRSSVGRTQILESTLRRLGMMGLGDRYPSELSGGQVQRVAIGRALATNPEVLLMDEPFASLDYYTRNEMENWLAETSEQEDRAILFVSHNIDEAIFLADRIVVVQGGALREFGVALSRPRAPDIRYDPEFLSLKKQLLDLMGQSR